MIIIGAGGKPARTPPHKAPTHTLYSLICPQTLIILSKFNSGIANLAFPNFKFYCLIIKNNIVKLIQQPILGVHNAENLRSYILL